MALRSWRENDWPISFAGTAEAGDSLGDSGSPIPTGRVAGDFNDRHGGFQVRLIRPAGCSLQLGLHLDDVFTDELFPELPLGTGTPPGAVLCLRHLVGKSSSSRGLDFPMFDPSGHGSRFSFRSVNSRLFRGLAEDPWGLTVESDGQLLRSQAFILSCRICHLPCADHRQSEAGRTPPREFAAPPDCRCGKLTTAPDHSVREVADEADEGVVPV